MRPALIPFLLLIIPILEITAFILVGGAIGLWPTLGLVIGSAILGTILLRRQGFAILRRIQGEIRAGRLPGRDLVHGVMILAAGILLLTPGLISDTIGLLLFVPAVRDVIWRFLGSRVAVVAASPGRWPFAAGGPGRSRPGVVELSDSEYRRRAEPPSPWHGAAADEDPPRTLH